MTITGLFLLALSLPAIFFFTAMGFAGLVTAGRKVAQHDTDDAMGLLAVGIAFLFAAAICTVLLHLALRVVS